MQLTSEIITMTMEWSTTWETDKQNKWGRFQSLAANSFSSNYGVCAIFFAIDSVATNYYCRSSQRQYPRKIVSIPSLKTTWPATQTLDYVNKKMNIEGRGCLWISNHKYLSPRIGMCVSISTTSNSTMHFPSDFQRRIVPSTCQWRPLLL